jgi:hypothetical protein
MKTHSLIAHIGFLTVFSLLQITCKKDPPVVPPIEPPPYAQSIFLAIADSGLTEVYLSLSMTDTLPPRGFEIFRNNNKVLSGSLFGKETTLVDTTAILNTENTYQAFRVDNALRTDSSAVIATRTLDTTSHEFVWSEYTFGGTSSSVFYGVSILDDNVIYALGNIPNGDSVFAIAKGFGNDWELIDLQYKNQEGDTLKLSIIRDLFVKNSASIYFFSGSIFEWTKSSKVTSLIYSRFSLPNSGGTIDKSFGIGPDKIWGVGRSGSIVYYNGSMWNPQTSGTTVDLTDIWGTPDGSTVWACGYSSDNMRSVLLEYKSGNWQTLWLREGSTPVAPYDFRVTNLWYKKRLYLCNTSHVYMIKNGVAKQISPSFGWLTYRIRGNDENDIVVVTEESAIWHFNGSNWKKIYQNPDQRFRSVAISGNVVAAVGNDVSGFPNKAVVVVGKR